MTYQELAGQGATGKDRSAGPGLAPVFAVVGSDGSGKTTLCEALYSWLSQSRPAALCHLGKQTGDYRRLLARLPLFGKPAAAKIVKSGDIVERDKGPPPLMAIATYVISMRRLRRFRAALALRRRGIAVIADRYPQIVVPGPKMDGVHLVANHPRSWITRALMRRERRRYAWMASFVPDLVIRLNVDLETAARRKPGANAFNLKRKIEMTPLLSFGGAPIVDIDAGEPADAVLEQAKRAILQTLGQGAGPSPAAAQPGASQRQASL